LRVAHAIALLVIAAIVTPSGSPGFAQAQDPGEMPKRASCAIENVAVVDVVRGEIASPKSVVIVDGRIVAMGEPEAITIPPEAVRVDGRGRYLMPGLVDMHVHLFNDASRRAPNDWAFRLFVATGVTGVREMRTEPAGMAIVKSWRAKSDRGETVAPRILAAGVAVGGGNGPDTGAATGNTARRQVRQAKMAGADFLKIFSEVREPQYRAVIAEARTLGMPACGHIPSEVSLLDGATAGQRTNEHLTQIYEACSDTEKQWLEARKGLKNEELVKLRERQEPEVLERFDQSACDAVAAELAKTDQVQVPTLVLPYFEAQGSPKDLRENPRWRLLRADEQARWEGILRQGYPSPGDKLAARRFQLSRQIVKTLYQAGVRILAGTDAPMPQVYPGFALHEELELLAESGLSPADVLRAATIWPAEFLGISESAGSLAVGKRADLVLLDENPLTDIRHTQRIRAVVLDGRLLQRADLDRLLEVAPGTK
jgi:hypothetical protein